MQILVLVKTVQKSHLSVIVQIVYNVLMGNFVFSENDKKDFTKQETVFNVLSVKECNKAEFFLQKYYKVEVLKHC